MMVVVYERGFDAVLRTHKYSAAEKGAESRVFLRVLPVYGGVGLGLVFTPLDVVL